MELSIDRPNLALSATQREQLSGAANRALEKLGLPEAVLTNSWMVDPVRMASLLRRLRTLIEEGAFDKLMPVNPSSDSYTVYNSIFRRLYKHLGGMKLSGDEGKKSRGYVNYVTTTALTWMRGKPLTQLVNEAVKYKLTSSKQANKSKPDQEVIDGAIRSLFELIEQTIRFRLVQWAKAYVDLLRFALVEEGRPELVKQVYDFSLALELGVSTTTGRSLVEFGLSRITASAISTLITDSSLTPEKVKAWLRSQPEELLSQLSNVILAELRAKDLLAPEKEEPQSTQS
jgi:hypothetical protein